LFFDHAPGPRLVVSIEGTGGYGMGLARAAAAGGRVGLECEQPNRKTRRGKGKSDPIDAQLAALRLDADRLPALVGTVKRCGVLPCVCQKLTIAGTCPADNDPQ
jgi:hypothetical protein